MTVAIGFGLLGSVLILSALAAGLVERAPISFPILFVALGFALGPHGVGLLAMTPQDGLLSVIATLTLSLILFLDAVNLERSQQRRDLFLPLLSLGPGTILVIAITAAAALLLFHVPVPLALLLGAILASTDPVVLRDVVRDRRIPAPVRRMLTIEAGANDVVVLPIVLVLIAVALQRLGSGQEWLLFLAKLLL